MSNQSSKVRSHWIVFLVLASILMICCFIFKDKLSDWFTSCTTQTLIVCILSILAGFFLLGYYWDRMQGLDFKSVCSRIGSDLSQLLAWVFSINGLFVLLICAIISGVVFIVRHSSTDPTDNQLQWLTLSLTVTLAALIPMMISRIVTKNQLNDLIDKKMNAELRKYKTSLDSIRRDKGHASRMSAVLLEQMSASGGSDDQSKQTCQDNAAWAIGWASDAIIQYLLIRETYGNALTRSAECLNIINKAASHITMDKGGIIKSNIKIRDLQSLVTMHSLIEKNGLEEGLQELAIELRNSQDKSFSEKDGHLLHYQKAFDLDDCLQTIEKAFYHKYENGTKKSPRFTNFCTISGMPEEFNKELNVTADSIIEKMKEPQKDQ